MSKKKESVTAHLEEKEYTKEDAVNDFMENFKHEAQEKGRGLKVQTEGHAFTQLRQMGLSEVEAAKLVKKNFKYGNLEPKLSELPEN